MTNATSLSSPTELARAGQYEDLEKLWLEEMAEPGDIARYLSAFDAMVETGKAEAVSVFASMLLEALDAADRQGDALRVLEHLAALKVREIAGIDDLTGKLVKAGFGSESWFDYILSKAGVSTDGMPWADFCTFWRCTSFLPGRVVHHRSGWGEGLITELHPEADEVEIRFASGRRHQVPWQSALDTMDPLPEWDIRAMRLTDAEGLLAFAKEQPVEIVRRTLRIFRGKATATQMKELLHDKVIPGRSWATWWRKAKTAAVEDPLIAVEGSSARPTFTLRKKALSLHDEASVALRHERRILRIIEILRPFLDRATRESDRDALVQLAHEKLDGQIDVDPVDVDAAQAMIYLVELDGDVSEQVISRLQVFLGGSDTPDLTRIAQIRDPSIRQRIATLIPRVFDAEWHRRAGEQLPRIPEQCDETLEVLVESIRAEKDPAVLVRVYEHIAPFPTRHPYLIYLLTKAYGEGDLESDSGSLDANVVCRVVMHALRVVSDPRMATMDRASRVRLQSRVITVLAGRSGVLKGLLERIDQPTMRSVSRIARGGGEDFPAKIQDMVERAVRDRFPELQSAVEDEQFWEDETIIYCTEKGIAARREEYRHVRDVLIPANSEAIGAAAAHGDLSENAEWDAAMEEQRNLTARASSYEEELKQAKILELQEIPRDIVSPGTRVRVLDLGENSEKTLRVLGPWDAVHGEDVVSYRAPLGAGLLGLRADQETVISLPSGELRLRVLAIETLF